VVDLLARVAQATHKRVVPPLVSEMQGVGGFSTIGGAPQLDYGDYLAKSNDVYSCAWLRAKMLAKLPIVATGATGEPDPQAQVLKLLARPNPHYSSMSLRIVTELAKAIWGRAVWVLERGPTTLGTPKEIWPVKPTQMVPVPDRNSLVKGYLFQPVDGSPPIPYALHEVVEFKYPSPSDPLAALAPMSAIQLAADVARESMRANHALFQNGLMMGGFLFPQADLSYTKEQAEELENLFDRRFRGVDKAHRWAVLRYPLELKQLSINPKDAEFISGANLTFRQVCRGMGVPPALVGDAEYATLANLTIFERQFWEQTGLFEAELFSTEVNRQLAPYMGVQTISLDSSKVVALQEDQTQAWARAQAQITVGAKMINEWRSENHMNPVPWGDVWWAPFNLAPVEDGTKAAPVPAATVPASAVARSARGQRRVDEYQQDEVEFAALWRPLVERQRDAILQLLRQQTRSIEDAVRSPFDLARWQDRTRAGFQARYAATFSHAVLSEGGALAINPTVLAQMLESKAIKAAIENTTRQFAHDVTLTTWQRVQKQLAIGMNKQESVEQMAARVGRVMHTRIEEARTVAQTEVTRAVTTGQIACFAEAGIYYKRWMTQEDSGVRESHQYAHGQTIPVNDHFRVGMGAGPGPGRMGDAAEDINCRCWLDPVEDLDGGTPYGKPTPGPGLPLIQSADLETLRDLLPEVET
jgi:HK97 family phage portal protein